MATKLESRTQSDSPDRNKTAPQQGPSKAADRDDSKLPAHQVSPLQLAFLFILALGAFSFLPRVTENSHLAVSFRAAAGILLVIWFLLRAQVSRTHRALAYDIAPRSVHYVQLMMHSCVYAYWGWYWRDVYHEIPLIIGQLFFAYALDMLLCWFRRDKWVLGFGPFPIILSTNLFLWFRDDWFYLQFLLIATGVLGKEFIKWKRDGRSTHIFNPSALSLFIFSLALLLTKNTDMTWGVAIATTIHRPPHIYLELFLLGLVVQSLFRVTLVTLASGAALYLLGLAYTHFTGVYHFIDSGIPVSVFLGLHLLVTDPATSPRKNFGKIIFGALYGLGVFIAYSTLSWLGAPEFYDKLLCVPILNLMVPGLDHLSELVYARFRSRGMSWSLSPGPANLGYMGIWAGLFVTMTATGFLSSGQKFPGSHQEFWQQACQQGKWNACKTWTRVLYDMCEDNSVRACLTVGQVLSEGRVVPRNAAAAGEAFGHGCDLGAPPACQGLVDLARNGAAADFQRACDGGRGDSCFILGTLFSSGLGVPQDPQLAFTMFNKSCSDGWWRGCGRLGLSYLTGQGTPVDSAKAVENFEKGCQGGNAASCFQVARLYEQGIGGAPDDKLASRRLRQACDLGLRMACGPGGFDVPHSSRTP
jgi:hypothetical protein